MRKTIEQLEHTEEFKSAVEKCKAERSKAGQNPDSCFAIVTEQFKKSGKEIFVKQAEGQVEQGLQQLHVKIYSEWV